MASINYGAKEISVKVVYYGPGLSGKTTNLQVIHQKVPKENKSNMVSLATETDRTLFFDFLPLDLGKIKGFATKFQLYTVPGQVYYNATRKLVLRGVDGVVFVADSSPAKTEENLESFQNLVDNLAEYGYQIGSIPMVIQYNKRDLPDALPVEQLQVNLNRYNLPWSEAVAVKGKGVFDTLKMIGKIVIDELNRKYSRAPGSGSATRPAPAAGARPMAASMQRPPMQPTPAVPPPQMRPTPMQPPPQRPMQAPPQYQQVAPQYQQQQQQPAFQPPPRPAAPPQRPMAAPPPMPYAPSDDPFADSTQYQAQAPQQYAPPAAPAGIEISQPAPQRPQFDAFAAPQQLRAAAPAPANYYDSNSISLDPAAQMQAATRPEDNTGTGKSELDLEIERYQREIEEKQVRSAGAPSAAFRQPAQPQAAPQYSVPMADAYAPAAPDYQAQQPQPAYQQFVQPQQAQPQYAAAPADVNAQDYDVYDIDSMPQNVPAGDAQQQYAEPEGDTTSARVSPDGNPMYFTSVNTDRVRKVRRPVNPKDRPNKSILSKFFGGKKESDE